MTMNNQNLFSDLMLSEDLVQHLASISFSTPTEVQRLVIPSVFMGRDCVACAQTGTGKTASFALPLIDMLKSHRARARMPRALVLVPTRELAQQVAAAFDQFGERQKLTWAILIGGTSIVDQEKKLDRGVDVLIATPGRFLDLVDRGKVLLSDLKFMVIDEADRMLDMGFMPDVERILSLLPVSRQTLLFSATLPEAVQALVQRFLNNPKQVYVTPEASTASTIEQMWLPVGQRDKFQAVSWILKNQADSLQSAFIFCNRKRDVDALYRQLKQQGFPVIAIHGDMHQLKRQEALAAFREGGESTILVASDVAARGIDVLAVSHVINVDIPMNIEDYVHRIGRTGRAGNTGRAFTLVTPAEKKQLLQMQELAKGAITELSWCPAGEKATAFPTDDDARVSTRSRQRSLSRSSRAQRDAITVVDEGATECAQETSNGRPAPRGRNGRGEGALTGTRQAARRPSRQKNPSGETRMGEEEPDGSFVGFGNSMPEFFRRSLEQRPLSTLPPVEALDAASEDEGSFSS